MVNGPYVDEVWQSVAVNQQKNTVDDPYFVHQSGTYQREPELEDDPFYSPSIASFCSNEQKACYFGSWGQRK